MQHRRQTGAAVLEFALLAPILLVIVFGIIGFGIIFAQQLSLENSARQAARYGVVAERTCGQIAAEAQDAADTVGLDGADATVSITVGQSEADAVNRCATPTAQPCKGSEEGDSVYVRLDYHSSLIIPLVVVDNDFPISGQGVFRCEFS